MKQLFSKFRYLIIPILILYIFFAQNLIKGTIPVPADSLIGLYHPFRDNSYSGFSIGQFPVKNPLLTDPVLQTYPWRFLTIDNIKNDQLPLWNPYSFSGQPLFANIQAASLQAINLLYFFLPFNLVWVLGIIIAPMLTGLFMYLFLRTLKMSPIAAAFGSTMLPLSGFFISWLTWGTIITTAMWLPLILYCINKVSEKISVKYFLILVFSVFQMIVSGHWQTAFYIFTVSIFYLFFRSYALKSSKLFLFVTLSFLIGTLLSSIQVVPSLEFIKLSNRVIDQTYSVTREDWFIPPQNLIQLLAPDFFGNPATNNYWGVWNYAEFVSYIGIVPLFFVLISLFKLNSITKAFWALTVVSLLFAVKNPVSQIPYILNLPFIASMQPSRIIFIFIFSLAVLSAHGFEYFIKENFRKKVIIPALFLFLLVAFLIFLAKFQKNLFPSIVNLDSAYIAFRNLLIPLTTTMLLFVLIVLKAAKVPKAVLVVILLTVTVAELFRFAYKFTPFSSSSILYPPTKTTDFLKSQQKPFRIMITDRRILNGNISTVYKIEQVSGYDPLYLESYAQLVASWDAASFRPAGSFNRIVTPQNYNLPLTNFMNVRFLLTFDDLKGDNLKKVFEEGQTKVYENEDVLPRAYFVKKVQQLSDSNQELSLLTNKDFDFTTTATSREYRLETSSTGTAQITSYHDQQMTIKTNSSETAPLIISNVNYPGWKAYINGDIAPINEVNFMFQSIIVPPGENTIKLYYLPQSVVYGLCLTILGALVTISIGVYLWKRESQ